MNESTRIAPCLRTLEVSVPVGAKRTALCASGTRPTRTEPGGENHWTFSKEKEGGTMKKAFLLAAGYGTRLRPITETIPKCLVSIHGQPLLGWWLALLLHGITDVLVNTRTICLSLCSLIQDCNQRKTGLTVYETYEPVNKAMNAILATQERGGTIYIMGNGGSAATASHMVCDFAKGASEALGGKKFFFECLSDNTPVMMEVPG